MCAYLKVMGTVIDDNTFSDFIYKGCVLCDQKLPANALLSYHILYSEKHWRRKTLANC